MSFPKQNYKSIESISKQVDKVKTRFTRPTVLSKLQGASEEVKRKAVAQKKKAEWITDLQSIRKAKFIWYSTFSWTFSLYSFL